MAKRPFQSLAYPLSAHQVEALNSMLETLFREFRRGNSTDQLSGVLAVDQGGTGRATAIPYSVITGGISTTGQHQSVADVGTAGQVLTSQGPGALPTWDDVAAALDDLTDVTITTPLDGDVLTYDSGQWVNQPPATVDLDDLGDVVITAPADNDVLTYDTGSGNWINEPASVTYYEWSVLTNGDVATPELIFAGGDVIMIRVP